MKTQLAVIAVLVVTLIGLMTIRVAQPSQDQRMEEFLRLPAQERADFISANLTTDIILLMGITPCGKP